MSSELTFSVVIPVYNNPTLATRAIFSVLRQTESVKEIILVDDASFVECAKKYALLVGRCRSQIPIILHTLPKNVGPGLARQAGASLASGTHVCFLDADDVWHRQKIGLVRRLIAETGAELVGHQRLWKFHYHKNLLSEQLENVAARSLKKIDFLIRNPMPTSSITARAEIAKIMFDFGGRKSEDYMALIYSTKLTKNILFLDLPLCAAFKPPSGHSGEGADQMAIYISSAANIEILKKSKVVSFWDVWIFYFFLAVKMPSGMIRNLVFQKMSLRQKSRINAD